MQIPDLRQELKLSPQLLQSMELLQMNSQELLDYLNQAQEENPLVELVEPEGLYEKYEDLRRQASWLDGGMSDREFSAQGEELLVADAAEGEGLAAFLCDQLERMRLSKPLLALCRYMTHLLDEDGRLLQEDLDSLLELGVPQSMVTQALEILQSLEPAGIGARSLSECLMLQLKRSEKIPPGAMDIAGKFLTEMSRGQYRRIADALSLPLEAIETAVAAISALEPRPGRGFQQGERTVYIRPDVFIISLDGELRAVVNEFYLPHVTINDYYVRLLRASDGKEEHAYLQQKLQQAKWLINSLERRDATLRACAEVILDIQHDFFAGSSPKLVPMNLAVLGQRISVHPSTVSRAVRNKYLQCWQGTFPLRYFFSRTVGTSGISQQEIQQTIVELISREDRTAPLSDRRIQEELKEQGITLARRTVAKYREKLGIPSVAGRRTEMSTRQNWVDKTQ